ncbi:MAG: amino acid racemase [candidate division WOR-3 bacterium]|nr:MAG: amino acid racemase [candidate division WOR-3 bacterium]
MKKIGIIGGLGPEATIDYYRNIIESYRKKRNENFPEIIIYSLNMKDFFDILKNKERDEIINWLSKAVKSLQNAGADFAIIASNTPHFVFDEVKALSPIPMLSIVEETCKKVENLGLKKLGLLGTKFTMSSDFYQKVFTKHNISIVVPNEQEQKYIQKKLWTEIIFNKIVEETRQELLKIVKRMIDSASIQGVILGCTELPLILTKDEFGIPFLNTTRIHVESAVSYCLR